MTSRSAVMVACVVACVACGLVVSPGYGRDWPQYKRNASRTGDAPEEVFELPLKRIVAVRFPYPIYASPAVVGERVYIQDARGHVACISIGANKVLWITELDGVHNLSSPAVAGGKVFIGSSVGYLAILDATTGKLLKKVEAGDGVITAPAVVNDSIYFSSMDGVLTKIDMEGNTVWTFKGGRKSYTEFAVKGREILFVAGSISASRRKKLPKVYRRRDVLFYNLLDEGRSVRLVEMTTAGHCPTSGPVFGFETQRAIQGFDSEEGSFDVLYQGGIHKVREKRCASRGTPSYRDGIYYRGHMAIDSARREVWQADPAAVPSGGFHSSPALARDFVVVGTEQGRVHFFEIASDGKEDGKKEPAKKVRKTKKGTEIREPVWSFETTRAGRPNGAVSSSPAVADGKVFFGGEDGVLYGLGKGEEVEIVDALPAKKMKARILPGSKLKGLEWHTAGRDMGYSCVSPDTTIKPPFRVKWKTRVWDTRKGPVTVAEGKAFVASRLGQVAALDAETGEVIWRANHPDLFSQSSATYVDGKILVLRGKWSGERGRGIWCHDAKTGEVLWRKSIGFGHNRRVDGLAVCDGKVFACWNTANNAKPNLAIETAAYNLADGKEVWTRKHKEPFFTRKLARYFRFSCVAGDGRFYFSIPGMITMAVSAQDGSVIWKSSEYTTVSAARLALRNGILLVFGRDANALDGKTGKHLWTGARWWRNGGSYMVPLTDGYLESQGKRNILLSGICNYGVYANGVWYSHTWESARTYLDAYVEEKHAKKGLVMKRMWRHSFLSNACPSPAIAYGRLYYSPNGEGVVYCFEPTGEEPEGNER